MELKNVSDFMELYFIKAIGKMIWISLFTNIDIYIFQTRNCPYKNSTVNLVLILFSFSSFMDYKKKPCVSIHQMDTFFGCQICVVTKLSKTTKVSIYGVQIVRKM